MAYLDDLGQPISNPDKDFDEVDTSQMTDEEIDAMIEQQFGWQDHNLNNGPEY